MRKKAQGFKPFRRAPLPKQLKRPRMDKLLREAILERSDHCCDLCRRRITSDHWECHHRLRRSQGGEDTLSNLTALHTRCHMHVHDNVTWSQLRGFLVPSYRDPLTWRVYRFGSIWMAPGAEWEVAVPHPEQKLGDSHG